jgi:hypothetical protein
MVMLRLEPPGVIVELRMSVRRVSELSREEMVLELICQCQKASSNEIAVEWKKCEKRRKKKVNIK